MQTTPQKIPPVEERSKGRRLGRAHKLEKKKADRVREARFRQSLEDAMPYFNFAYCGR